MLQRFPFVARRLVEAGLCLEHAGNNHSRTAIRFQLEGAGGAVIGEWHPWEECADNGAGGGGGGAAGIAIRFPYFLPLFRAFGGFFEREVPAELWLYREGAPGRFQAGTGMRREIERSIPALVRRPLRPFLAAVLTEISLCNVCSCQEILRRNGRGQESEITQAWSLYCGSIAAGTPDGAAARLASGLAWRVEEWLLAQRMLLGCVLRACVLCLPSTRQSAKIIEAPWLVNGGHGASLPPATLPPPPPPPD
jgi:hypothetical protein